MWCAVVFAMVLSSAGVTQQNGSGLAKPAAAPSAPSVSTPSPEIPESTATPDSPLAEAATETKPINPALEAQIQEALDRDPIFSQGSLKVTVGKEGIELSGDLASGRDRQNAARIVQSYAHGKKVINHILVKGHGPQPVPISPANPPGNFDVPGGHPATSQSTPP
jgi:hypothetical protein